MTATQPHARPLHQRKVARVPVSDRAVMDFTRILTCAGQSHEWQGTQPEEIANVRDNCARGITKTGRNAFLCLLWNGLAQRIADFVDAQRRAALGQSHAQDIPSLILRETEDECAANVLEARVLAGQAERAEKVRLAEKARDQARDLLALVEALNDDVHGATA